MQAEADLAALSRGFAEDQTTFGLSLLGGDTIRSTSGLVLSITIFGAVTKGRMIRRAAATPGDRLYVSGTLGDAALGLVARLDPARAALWGLAEDEAAHLARRYLLPEPRNALAPAIAAHAGAAMDVSDGLGLDLGRMIRASGVGARVDLARLPLSKAARRAVATDPAALSNVFSGGDDYEILAAVAPDRTAAFEAAATAAGVVVTAIGEIVAEPGLEVLEAGRPSAVRPDGYRHF